jgi:hypothetical protein
MVKAADALTDAGYDVRVVSGAYIPWLIDSDRRLHARRRWRWQPVPYARRSAPRRWFVSGLRQRVALRRAARPATASAAIAARAVGRIHPDLVRAIRREPADLVYAGTLGALAAAAEAAGSLGVPYGIDFEDFHAGEQEGDDTGALRNALAARVMKAAATGAAFVTSGSAAIAAACEQDLGVVSTPIHNVFPLPSSPPRDTRPDGTLRLYWFSQTIGPNRGLETVIAAAGLSGRRIELHLRGRLRADYLPSLRARTSAFRGLQLHVHPLIDPDGLVESCQSYDVGVASEPGHPRNNDLALGNKACTYILAGLPVALTETTGQAPLIADLGAGALPFTPAQPERLAAALDALAEPARLQAARDAAWTAAIRRWHWEHEDERGRLLALASRALR